ncbi:starch-binding domain-containing protein 1 isoform X1 [Engystomops pustulosus]|uniref:starch-binding domain-containing protein 1 isoform X1 n=1 Tax=Engystomops pustulosus TaxID=76066 RepID=UPI003AFB4D51
MVHGSPQLHRPIQGKPDSGADGSMWPVLVLGILTAIFAWIWYKGSPEGNGPEHKQEELLDPPVIAEATTESELSAPDTASQRPDSTAILTKEELEVHSQEHSTAVLTKEELQADIQELPTAVLTKEELQADLRVHDTAVLTKEDLNVDSQELPTAVQTKADIQELPTAVQTKEKLEADIQELPTAVQTKERLEADIQDLPTAVLKEEELQVDIQELPTAVLSKEELQAASQVHPTAVLKVEEPQANIQEDPTAVLKEEEPEAYDQKASMKDIKVDDQVSVLDHQIGVVVKEDSLLAEHHEDLLQNNLGKCHKGIPLNNEELHSYEMEPMEMLNNVNSFPLLQKEAQHSIEEGSTQNLSVEQADREVVCPTSAAEELEAQKVLENSCQSSMWSPEYEQGKETLHPIKVDKDGVYARGEVNAEKNATENATGCRPESSFAVKPNEKARSVFEAEEKLNKDSYLEITSPEHGDTNVADQFMTQESVEKCDIETKCNDTVKPTGLQEIVSESDEKGLFVQKLEYNPESLPVDIYNLLFNQEKQMAGLCVSNKDDKTSFGSFSETNILETDTQKTRKIAAIQPMPQNVSFTFKVHYITHSDSQVIAIIGDHEKLGRWEEYVPLNSVKDGFWSYSIALPADTNIAWKLVMVENGKIERWEECNNRFLKIAHEDIEAQIWWGYP